MKTTNDFQKLYERAKSAGLVHTQKQFASFCGIAEATVSKIMNGVEKFLTDDLYGKMEYAIMKGTAAQQSSDERLMNERSSSDVDQSIIASLIKEMTEQRIAKDLQIQRSQDQIDRLITMLEDRGASLHKAQ